MTVARAAGPDGREITIDDAILDPHRRALESAHEPVRTVFAAAHVVLRASYRTIGHSRERPGAPDEIGEHVDWRATRALRAHLDACGFGIAEAMDTAQRFELGWTNARRLIELCGTLAPANGFVAGAGVDHLEAVRSKADLVDGVVEQGRFIQQLGGIAIILPLLWLAEHGCDESDYVDVYSAIVRELDGPLLVHWLGEMFLPGLRGYFPGDSFSRVMALDPEKVRGCKLSLLDAGLELRTRRELLPRDQVVLTGDDFHFAALIRGGDPADLEAPAPGVQRVSTLGSRPLALGDFSHALLGVFDGIARPAGLALALLAQGDLGRYSEIMEPCELLGRHVFEEPTRCYKAGLAFLAWLNGLQDDFTLVNHEQRARTIDHYLRTAELAARAGALGDAEFAAARLEQLVSAPGPTVG